MLKTVLLLALVAACGSSGSDKCEQLRDQFQAWNDQRAKEALGGEEASPMKDREIAAAKTEHAQIDAKFVAACQKIGADKIDATCFETTAQMMKDDKDRKQHCRDSTHAVEAEIFGKNL